MFGRKAKAEPAPAPAPRKETGPRLVKLVELDRPREYDPARGGWYPKEDDR